MTKQDNSKVYVFQGDAMSNGNNRCKAGSRHELVLFAKAASIEDAQQTVTSMAQSEGWEFLSLKKGSELTAKPEDMPEGYLRSAVEKALELGKSLIAYDDELPADS